jgi:hypothetical protein
MLLVHRSAGIVAIGLIGLFWLSTAISELWLSEPTIVSIKSLIPFGFLFLVPAIATAGITGIKLAKGRNAGIVGTKLKRMPFVAVNGLVVLIPSALFLASRAKSGNFDTWFYIIQTIELLAGATNFTLLALNMRDGFKMTSGRRRRDARR